MMLDELGFVKPSTSVYPVWNTHIQDDSSPDYT